jgi:branched-chain amino acid transport system substrate-binding protein
MQHKMKQLAGAALVAAMSLAGTAHAQQVEDVKVGFAGPMTGAQAHYGAKTSRTASRSRLKISTRPSR